VSRKRIFSMEELEAFDLNRVHKLAAKFDPEKINGSSIFNQTRRLNSYKVSPHLIEKGFDIEEST
jgi:hypothetical protein